MTEEARLNHIEILNRFHKDFLDCKKQYDGAYNKKSRHAAKLDLNNVLRRCKLYFEHNVALQRFLTPSHFDPAQSYEFWHEFFSIDYFEGDIEQAIDLLTSKKQ